MPYVHHYLGAINVNQYKLYKINALESSAFCMDTQCCIDGLRFSAVWQGNLPARAIFSPGHYFFSSVNLFTVHNIFMNRNLSRGCGNCG